jgi:pimeloyl-ACP methyl ester carboxylesterase
VYLELMSSDTLWRNTAIEARAAVGAARALQDVRKGSTPPDVPVVVISGTRRPFMAETIRRKHEALVQRFPAGRSVVAEGCGHHIPFERPEVVVSAVRDLLDDAQP